ncbi:hypothetical protein ABK040_000560 [Willaertia magna]
MLKSRVLFSCCNLPNLNAATTTPSAQQSPIIEENEDDAHTFQVFNFPNTFSGTTDSVLKALMKNCKLTSNGDSNLLYCNDSKMLLNKNSDHLYFCNKEEEEMVIDVVTSVNYLFFITNKEKAFGLGKNHYGQLGIGEYGITLDHDEEKMFPIEFEENIEDEIKVKSISTSIFHSVLVTDDGKVFSTGYNGFGQLGFGHLQNRNKFTQMKHFYESDGSVINNYRTNNNHNENTLIPKIKKSFCGAYHTLLLTNDNQVFGCGLNATGALGTTDAIGKLCPTRIDFFSNLDNNDFVKDIKCGYEHTIFLTNNGDVYATGHNYDGQLGVGAETPLTLTPLKIVIQSKPSGASGVGIFENHNNSFMTSGPSSSQPIISGVTTMREVKFREISCGFSNTVLLTTDNDVYVCGSNIYGRLGLPLLQTLNNSNIQGEVMPQNRRESQRYTLQLPNEGFDQKVHLPIRLSCFDFNILHPNDYINEIYCGLSHCLFVTKFGCVFGCGSNLKGQLGNHFTPYSYEPLPLISNSFMVRGTANLMVSNSSLKCKVSTFSNYTFLLEPIFSKNGQQMIKNFKRLCKQQPSPNNEQPNSLPPFVDVFIKLCKNQKELRQETSSNLLFARGVMNKRKVRKPASSNP